MRQLVASLVVMVACSAAPLGEAPTAGGFVNGICQPTTRTDAMGIITATGSFGLVGPVHATADDAMNHEILVVWRGGGPGVDLEVQADGLDPALNTKWVRWGAIGPVEGVTPWGNVAYRVGLKPIGRAGCWRLGARGAPPEDGVVIFIRPS
ncbi:MAG: hypothetical protein AUH85_00450 [Chloroflexi bacterium 13_1_40CM_4_68_4]|nr:MAG: hypothetical protein AUH85_00450 [Chloroflexi bacterium 13_1_40CM_4_68_4]